jgi:hypothetical protein
MLLNRSDPDVRFYFRPNGPSCNPHIVINLEIHPFFRGHAKILAEAESLIDGNRAFSVCIN